MKKNKMTKDIVPQNFTMALALVDAIPVLFCSATMVLIGVLFRSILFQLGACLVLFAGTVKVLWKIIVVLQEKNVWWMFVQMRILMPLGMLLMILSLIIEREKVNGRAIWQAITSMPSGIFFGIGILGMLIMTVFAFRLDSSDVRSNWIEQITNGIVQAAIFLGVIFLFVY